MGAGLPDVNQKASLSVRRPSETRHRLETITRQTPYPMHRLMHGSLPAHNKAAAAFDRSIVSAYNCEHRLTSLDSSVVILILRLVGGDDDTMPLPTLQVLQL